MRHEWCGRRRGKVSGGRVLTREQIPGSGGRRPVARCGRDGMERRWSYGYVTESSGRDTTGRGLHRRSPSATGGRRHLGTPQALGRTDPAGVDLLRRVLHRADIRLRMTPGTRQGWETPRSGHRTPPPRSPVPAGARPRRRLRRSPTGTYSDVRATAGFCERDRIGARAGATAGAGAGASRGPEGRQCVDRFRSTTQKAYLTCSHGAWVDSNCRSRVSASCLIARE